MNWACGIPFPPNIVQLGLSKKQALDEGKEREEAK
jgi:hypothetical protein